MKIIFICTRSITFNTFLKSQAEYFLKKGFKVEVACSDVKDINLKKNSKHLISFPTEISALFNLKNYFKVYKQIRNLVKKNPNALFYLHTPVASHIFRNKIIFLNKFKNNIFCSWFSIHIQIKFY